ILVSYNGDNYDFKYLQERAKILKLTPLIFGKFDGVEKKLKFEKSGISVAAYIDELPHIDLFPVARQLFSLPKYDLNNVYFEIFGKKGKEDLDKSKIYEIWDDVEKDEISKQNLNKFFQYSLKDSEITLEIALSLLPLYIELSHITGMPLQKTTRMGSGMRVEHLLMSKSYKKNLLIPNKRGLSSYGEEEGYAGGFVLEPKKGLHNNIIVFDFRSLYPSIIISHNIDPFTINCECCKNEDDNKISTNDSTFWFCKKKVGFIPEVLKLLVERRIELKNLMKNEENLEKKKILDVQQQALKILVNSAYGYMGFARARWYSKECVESVTAYGRKYIQQVMDEARNSCFDVIYGDTDSIFITKQNKNKDEILEDANKFLKIINNSLPGMIELDLQGFYPTGIFITKKRYALIEENGRLIVKGLETKRRDWANIAKETQKEVLTLILKEKNVKKAVDLVRKKINNIKERHVGKEDLVIYTKLTRSVDSYIQKKEPHVAAVKRAINKGINFEEGDIIAYIVTKKGREINEKTMVAELVKEGDYDANYYIDNQILPAVMRIMEAMNYSENELKGMEKQMKLF
ncbi:MAG: DNA-directed DNA polymerase, partial [Candidatus Altarchaeum sp.]|nr:DNA-directed DNA polymerase [Candidatus Altarchaeum sp.]